MKREYSKRKRGYSKKRMAIVDKQLIFRNKNYALSDKESSYENFRFSELVGIKYVGQQYS